MDRRTPLFWRNAVARIQKGRFGTLLGMTPEELGGTLRVEAPDDRESLVPAPRSGGPRRRGGGGEGSGERRPLFSPVRCL